MRSANLATSHPASQNEIMIRKEHLCKPIPNDSRIKKLSNRKPLRQAASDEASRGMANEGCPNEPASSVPDATGYSGADDAAERQ